MLVQINKKWRLRTDSHQWILEQLRKDGKRWDTQGYYRDLGNAFRILVDREIYESDLMLPSGALVPLHQALADLRADIEAAVETLKDGQHAG